MKIKHIQPQYTNVPTLNANTCHLIHLNFDEALLLWSLAFVPLKIILGYWEKVQVGKDQEKTQSEKDSHSKNRGGKKPK